MHTKSVVSGLRSVSSSLVVNNRSTVVKFVDDFFFYHHKSSLDNNWGSRSNFEVSLSNLQQKGWSTILKMTAKCRYLQNSFNNCSCQAEKKRKFFAENFRRLLPQIISLKLSQKLSFIFQYIICIHEMDKKSPIQLHKRPIWSMKVLILLR